MTQRHEEITTREGSNAGNPYEAPKVPATPGVSAEAGRTSDTKAPHPIATLALGAFAIGISLLMAYGFFTIYSQPKGIVGGLSFLLLAVASVTIVARLLYRFWHEQ